MPPDPALLPEAVKRLITDPTNNSGSNNGNDAATGGGAPPDPALLPLPGTALLRRPLKIRRKKKRKRFRGLPPPALFAIDALPDSALLTETETAAVLRRSKTALSGWRQQPNHPLRWRRVAHRILCEVPSIRALLRGDEG